MPPFGQVGSGCTATDAVPGQALVLLCGAHDQLPCFGPFVCVLLGQGGVGMVCCGRLVFWVCGGIGGWIEVALRLFSGHIKPGGYPHQWPCVGVFMWRTYMLGCPLVLRVHLCAFLSLGPVSWLCYSFGSEWEPESRHLGRRTLHVGVFTAAGGTLGGCRCWLLVGCQVCAALLGPMSSCERQSWARQV